MEYTTKLIQTAKSELEASKYLYEGGFYPQSYSKFQLSSELMNKVIAISLGITEPDKLKKLGHNQLKVYRLQIVEMFSNMNLIPSNSFSPIMKEDVFEDIVMGLDESVRFIDGLWDENLTELSADDLNLLAKQLQQFKNVAPFDMTLESLDILKGKLQVALQEIETSSNKLPVLQELKKVYHKALESEQELIEFAQINQDIAKKMMHLGYWIMVLLITGLLTTQHNNQTRYISDNGKSPLEIYTTSLPIVQKQPIFLDFLSDAIDGFLNIDKWGEELGEVMIVYIQKYQIFNELKED